MNCKGFTLFTALISFILIGLTALLVTTMIGTENSQVDILLDLQEQNAMVAIADLTRADALQIFNVGLRIQMQDWINLNTLTLDSDDLEQEWDEMVTGFGKQYFGIDTDSKKNPYAHYVASWLSNTLNNKIYYKHFEITYTQTDESSLENSLIKVIDKTTDIIQVVDCEEGKPSTCVGTFYFNLDFGQIDDATYEKLPKIRVKNLLTGRVIEEPVLPKGQFRVFVPIRLFKAISLA
ncbi:MAG: hypothetical protein ABH821_01730, partial [archaeon]